MNNQVLIAPAERQTIEPQLVNGIWRPAAQSPERRANEGLVLAVGPGRRTDDGSFYPTKVQPGDRVLFANYSGADLLFGDDGSVLLMREEEVLCKIHEPTDEDEAEAEREEREIEGDDDDGDDDD